MAARQVVVPQRALRALAELAEDCMAATYRNLRDALTETVPRARLGDDAMACDRRARDVVPLAEFRRQVVGDYAPCSGSGAQEAGHDN